MLQQMRVDKTSRGCDHGGAIDGYGMRQTRSDRPETPDPGQRRERGERVARPTAARHGMVRPNRGGWRAAARGLRPGGGPKGWRRTKLRWRDDQRGRPRAGGPV